MNDPIPAALARDLIAVSRLYGLWRGALIGLAVGIPAGALIAVLILRGVLA